MNTTPDAGLLEHLFRHQSGRIVARLTRLMGLLLELGRVEEANVCHRAALERRCSEPERRFLKRKLAVSAPGHNSFPSS